MIDQDLVKNKIKLILDDMVQLKRFEDKTFDEIAKDYDTHKIVERIIEVVINEALDINQHLVAQSELGETPYDYEGSFELLGKLNVLPLSFAEKIKKSVGLRNILVHQYRQLDEERFYHSIKDCLEQYTKYCNHLLEYLKSIA